MNLWERNALRFLAFILWVILCFGSTALAEEVDLVRLFGNPILALASHERVQLRQKKREFRVVEEDAVNERALRSCQMAGFSRVKEYGVASSAEPEVWRLSRGNRLAGVRTEIFDLKILDRASRFAHWPFPAEKQCNRWDSIVWSAVEGSAMGAALGLSPILSGDVTATLVVTPVSLPVCTVIGFATGVASIPVRLIGFACEFAWDYTEGTYGPMEHLVFERLVCDEEPTKARL